MSIFGREKKEKKDKSEKKEKRAAEEVPESEAKRAKTSTSNFSDLFNNSGNNTATEEEITAFRKANNIAVSGSLAKDIGCFLSFKQANLDSDVNKCVAQFPSPSLIQAQAWPALLRGNDVIGIAETGYVFFEQE